MPEHEPLDYRLRRHTKRTDLPADVLRDIGEAYAEIKGLREELDEARREIMNNVIDQACSNEEIEEEYRKRGWSYLKKENTND
jgi:hypothetical protein